MRADGENPVRSLFRGRIDKPVAGWISLENLDTGFRWVRSGLVCYVTVALAIYGTVSMGMLSQTCRWCNV